MENQCIWQQLFPYYMAGFAGVFLGYLFYPWRADTAIKKILLFAVPPLYLLAYGTYEFLWARTCTQVNIRLDFYLVWPMMGAMLLLFLIKLFVVRLRANKA